MSENFRKPRASIICAATRSPGVTTIFVNLKGSTTASEVPDIWYQVRKNIGDIRHTLPAGVVGPGFNDDFGDTYGLIYGFTADGFTHRELRDYVEDIRSRLLQVPDVSKIEILGAQDEQIFVEFSTQQLAGLGIDRAALIAALQAQNAVSPAGSLQTGNEKLLIRVSGAFRSENDILDVNFLSNGRLIRLRDIAEVRRALADPPQPMFRVNGKPAIGLAIAMRDGGDILALGRNVKVAIGEAVADLPLGIDATLVSDQPVVVKNAIGEFMESLWQAIAIIMAVSIVSLGFRPGAVVALSIPLTMAIIFPIMEGLGIDLQRISLGALIIALGLLVDDAMTTVDVMTSRLAAGDSKEQAATFAYKTLAFPMLTGSFVTAAGFVPIGFARSAAGEYTFSIFAVVTIALIVSWFVAVLFAPLLGVWLLKKPAAAAPEQQSVILRMFRAILVGAMRLRWLTIALTLICFVVSLLALPYVPRQFFPASDRPELVVDLTLPQNASIFASDEAAAKLDAILKDDPDVARWSTYVGRGAIRFYLPLNVQLANDFFAQAVVVAKNVAARERLHAKLEKALAEQLPGVVARVSPLELGPPVGWPVQYRVSGPDLAQVRSIALRLGQTMGADAQSPAGQFRLDGAVPQSAHPNRSGSGPASRTELASAGRGFEHRDDRDADHPAARQHLPHQCRRPRPGRAAGLALDLARVAAAAPEWPHRAAEPSRDVRFRARIPVGLAAPARADIDGAGRRRVRRDARSRGPVARSGGREAQRKSAERLSH